MMFSDLLKLLNSKFFLLIIGFILTGLVGSYLNYRFQEETWERQADHEYTATI